MYFYFWVLLLNFEKGKGKKFEESKKNKRKRGAEIIEDERRKANKLSKDQNERKGRIGKPTVRKRFFRKLFMCPDDLGHDHDLSK